MDEPVGSARQLGQGADVGQVARDDLDRGCGDVARGFRVTDQGDDAVPACRQVTNESPPDETGGAGHHDAHWRQ